MAEAIKYLVDEAGKKTSVVVPLEMWDALNDEYKKLQNKLAVFSNVQEGLKEVAEAKRTGKKLQTLKDFLK